MEIQETIKTILGKYDQAQGKSDTEGMSRAYLELIGARNYLAVSKGFSNFLDLQKDFYQISNNDWEKYLLNRDIFASKFSPQLKNANNSPHFLSELPSLKISFPEGVFTHVSQKYPEITKLKDKIAILNSNTGASYKYSKDGDHYDIFIPLTNHNQKISMLIHELAHVLNQEISQHQIPNAYTDEFKANQIEIDLVRNISKEFFQAVISEYLICLVRTDFQNSLFKNPDQDQVSLYSTIFEKYIGNLDPQKGTDFLSDKKLIFSPLVDFSSAVAIVNLLT